MSADQTHVLAVEAGEGGRLDRFVAARLADLSRTAVQRLIDDGFITLNGSICKASDKVGQGDVIVVRIPPPAPTELIAEDIPLTIVYEDDDVVVIDKPAGLVVHPAAGHDQRHAGQRAAGPHSRSGRSSAAKCVPASCIVWTKTRRASSSSPKTIGRCSFCRSSSNRAPSRRCISRWSRASSSRAKASSTRRSGAVKPIGRRWPSRARADRREHATV